MDIKRGGGFKKKLRKNQMVVEGILTDGARPAPQLFLLAHDTPEPIIGIPRIMMGERERYLDHSYMQRERARARASERASERPTPGTLLVLAGLF